MKNWTILLTLIIIMLSFGCGRKGNNNAYIKSTKKLSCSVEKKNYGLLISCPDGSSQKIVNGSSCSTFQMSNGVKVQCTDGTFAYVYNGAPGADGKNGKSCTISSTPKGGKVSCDDGSEVEIENGQSCSVQDVGNGALLTCGMDSVIVYDGVKGDKGDAGEDALAGAIGIANYIFPCGKEFNGDEVLLKLTDGNILALYDGGPNEDRLALLYPGNWITTDRNKNHTCHFTIDANLNITNEYVN